MTTKPKRLHWMPLDWPAYWADTRAWFGRPDLHGAYMNLLGELWMRREPIPLDDKLAAVVTVQDVFGRYHLHVVDSTPTFRDVGIASGRIRAAYVGFSWNFGAPPKRTPPPPPPEPEADMIHG